jgi:hypothetical protein
MIRCRYGDYMFNKIVKCPVCKTKSPGPYGAMAIGADGGPGTNPSQKWSASVAWVPELRVHVCPNEKCGVMFTERVRINR